MLIRDKNFYKTFLSLNAMMAAQNLLAFGVNLVDNIMLGRYSETALAAATLVNQVQYLLQMIIVAGLGAGTMVMVSQYWGKNEAEPIRRIVALAMKFAAGIGALFFIVAFFFPYIPINLLTNQEAVKAEGLLYIRVMAFTYLTFPLQSTLVTSLRGVKTAHIGPITAAVSLVTNLILNYMFIYGNWGAPEMGIRGAAIATLIARVFELLIVVVYVRFFDRKIFFKFLSILKLDWFYLRSFVQVVTPVVVGGAIWGFGMMMQLAILGRLSEPVVAAGGIAIVVFQIVTVYSFGAANTNSVMVGNIIGAGQYNLVRPYTYSLQLVSVFNGLLTGLVLFLARDLILSFYILSDETYEIARGFITLLAFVSIFSSYEYPIQNGTIMGGGNTRYALYMDIICLWLFALPLAALSVFVWHMPPYMTMLFLKADQFLKCIPNSIVVNRFRWVRDLTKEGKPKVKV